MAEIFEVTPECAEAVKDFCNNATKYQPKHPKLRYVIVQVGGYSVGYLVDRILTNLAPAPVKFPVMAAKIAQKIGIMVLSGMAAEKAARYLEEQYDKSEQVVYDSVEKMKTAMKEDEDGEAVTE